MSEIIELAVSDADKGNRADKYISDNIAELTRSAVQNLITQGNVLADGKAVAKNYKLRGGEILSVEIPEPQPLDAQPEDIPLDIVYEDDDLLVVNKAKGMVVHPAHGNHSGTLVDVLRFHNSECADGQADCQ